MNCIVSVPANQWKGEYFNNQTLSGSPTMVRDDSTPGSEFLTRDFVGGSPNSFCAPAVDNFSARWTRTVSLAQGIYRFTTNVDNGVRLYVDGYLRIDQWGNLPPNTYTADVFLSAGDHEIRVEFIEYTGNASVSLSWTAVSGANCYASVPEDRWKGEYYSNTNLSGSPARVSNDGGGSLNFDFGSGGPGSGCGLGVDYFSARWTRTVNLGAGVYRFSVTGDDGVRLYVAGQLVIDKWFTQAATTYTADLTFSSAGPRQIKLEYFESSGPAVALLSWTDLTGVNCLPNLPLPLISSVPQTGGRDNIASIAPSQTPKRCGQKNSD
ncbi:MAG TPA: PA14 domain-containing protein [Blastocatellia bacterium]